jgi:hypothetical protein
MMIRTDSRSLSLLAANSRSNISVQRTFLQSPPFACDHIRTMRYVVSELRGAAQIWRFLGEVPNGHKKFQRAAIRAIQDSGSC